ncbi:MAG: hypothetical protein EA397_10655 [Deltaproteobacteria bacterium]|nr:MAG: hypothetical protein EA397_10655 [Deltaproteobacteria bacterium]
MIFITVGTHHQPFDRLVRAARELAETHEVLLQRGVSTEDAGRCRAVDFLPPPEMTENMRRARIVVAHAGPATLFEAAALGQVPIVVPRDPAHGEHIDDHQLRFVERLEDRLVILRDPRELPRAVVEWEARKRSLLPFEPDPSRTRGFALGVEQVCQRVVASRRRSRPGRDTLRALIKWMLPPL